MDDLFELYSPDALILGQAAREQFAQFPPLPDEQVQTIIAYQQQQETNFLAALKAPSGNAAVQTFFHEVAAAVQEKTGTPPTWPNLCASFLLSFIYMPLLRSALAERERHPEAFIALYDYASGIVAVAHEVLIAEGELEGVAKTRARHAIALAGEKLFRKPLPEAIAKKAYTRRRARDKKAGQLLTQDPTGKTLIATAIDEICFEIAHPDDTECTRRIMPYQNPQLFLAGSEYAQRIYTVLYPRSQ